MSIASVVQTIRTPPNPALTPVSTPGSAGTSFATVATSGAAHGSSASANPIASLSSALQKYLLQQQSHGSVAGHHPGDNVGDQGGTHVDAPNLPGRSAASASG